MIPNPNVSRKPFPLPVVALGPGTQNDDAPEFPQFPKEMHTFTAPHGWMLREAGCSEDAVAWLERFFHEIAQCPEGPVVAAVDELSEPQRRWIEDAFGVGEVVAQTAAPFSLRVRESAFPGIWHEVVLGADGAVVRDEWRYAPYSARLVEAMTATSHDVCTPPQAPTGVMNGPALVEELRHWAGKGTMGRAVHVLNLTLLPLTPADLQMLNDWLGPPMVAIAIRSYGQCRVASTRLRDVWRVQYFNSMDALILDTIEVTRLPEVVRAAPEDLALTRSRLADYLAELAR
jgi:hydrogenase-1 operon protein HyaF